MLSPCCLGWHSRSLAPWWPEPFGAHVQAGTAEAEEPKEPWPQQPFRRGWRFNWPGVVLMAIYCLAFIFYLYIRIRYTLDLGAYVWCGSPDAAASWMKWRIQAVCMHCSFICKAATARRWPARTSQPQLAVRFCAAAVTSGSADTPANLPHSSCCLRGRWGAFVLGVEILGATSTVLYGLNIILTPVHEPLIDDPANPGLTKVITEPASIYHGGMP